MERTEDTHSAIAAPVDAQAIVNGTSSATCTTAVETERAETTADLPELANEDGRPAFAELEHLADQLPPTERAAVVLRYGYDLDYADIGAALGSNSTAARQAASSGIRRLRQKGLT